jgi:GNAT superfamily N-acetyltransferase
MRPSFRVVRSGHMDEIAAFRAFDLARMSMLSTRTVAFDGGTAFFDDDYPERYISNVLVVEAVNVPARRLLETAGDLLGGAGLSHRRIRMRDDDAAARSAPSFRAAGYADERTRVMVHRRPPDRPAVVPAEEVRFDDVRELTEEIYRRELSTAPETATRFVEQHARWDAILGTRRFVARLGGEPVGQCELYAIGPDAQIEYVDTLEEHRGRGIARAVVLAALDAARSDGVRHVFICADDDDWPKALYERLGFEPIGREWDFTRVPAT